MYCSHNERMSLLSKTWTKLDSHLLCSVTLVCMVKGNAGQAAASSTIMSSLLLWHIFKNSFNLGGYTGLNVSIPRAASKKLCIKAEQTAVLSLQPTHVPAVSRAALPQWIQPVAGRNEAHHSVCLLFTHWSTAGYDPEAKNPLKSL